MEKKRSFGQKLEAFFAGHGFYLVLLLCAAIIGVSAWVLLSDSGVEPEPLPVVNLSPSPAPATQVPASPSPPAVESAPASPEAQAGDTETGESAAAPSTAPDTETALVEEEPLYVWPVNGAVLNPYSMDKLVYNRTMADWRVHEGLDIAADLGTEVLAVSGGVVTEVYEDDRYGTTVVIDHQNGVVTTYSNLAQVPTVAVGDSIMAGEILGSVGDTALWEAGEPPHLHLAMTHDGISVDPATYLPTRE